MIYQPNETSRVRYPLQSIKTSDPTICAAKNTIKADNNMKNDFELAADFLIATAPTTKFNNNQCCIIFTGFLIFLKIALISICKSMLLDITFF